MIYIQIKMNNNKLHNHYINANIFKLIKHLGLNIIMGINRIHVIHLQRLYKLGLSKSGIHSPLFQDYLKMSSDS